MKAYSANGIFDKREASTRRKSNKGPSCCAFLTSDGWWQLDSDPAYCREAAIKEGTGKIRYFSGSYEEWLDGKPYTVEQV